MSYEFYKTLHLMALLLLFFSFGVLFLGLHFKDQLSKGHRMLGFIGHGVGLFLMLLSGFGMAARLQIFSQWPSWLTAKLGIWLLLGLAVGGLKRAPQYRNQIMALIMILGCTAVFLVVQKSVQ